MYLQLHGQSPLLSDLPRQVYDGRAVTWYALPGAGTIESVSVWSAATGGEKLAEVDLLVPAYVTHGDAITVKYHLGGDL
jgi:hypothetical protein